MGYERKHYGYVYATVEGNTVEVKDKPFDSMDAADARAKKASLNPNVSWAQAGFIDPKTGAVVRNGRRRARGH